MAFRATNNDWRSVVAPLGGNRPFATSAAPKMKQFAENVRHAQATESTLDSLKNTFRKPAFAPVWVLMGFIVLPVILATHSLKQQVVHAPGVVVDKKKRASIYEADEPDVAIGSSDKFINKSYLRKLAHIQDPGTPTVPDSLHPDPFTRQRKAETLKTVGVNPSRQ